MTKHKPATPLPWTTALTNAGQFIRSNGSNGPHGYFVEVRQTRTGRDEKADAAYIAHAANAYPRLVEALRKFARATCDDDGVADSMPIEDCTELTEGDLKAARALLKELGEE